MKKQTTMSQRKFREAERVSTKAAKFLLFLERSTNHQTTAHLRFDRQDGSLQQEPLGDDFEDCDTFHIADDDHDDDEKWRQKMKQS